MVDEIKEGKEIKIYYKGEWLEIWRGKNMD